MEERIKIIERKLLDKQSAVAKRKNDFEEAMIALERAEIEARDLEFELELLKRTGKIEEIFWRFPHIGRKIFQELHKTDIAKCLEVNNWCKIFIDEQKILPLKHFNSYFCNALVKKLQRYDLPSLHQISNRLRIFISHHYKYYDIQKSPLQSCNNNLSCHENEFLSYLFYKGHFEVAKIMIENTSSKNPQYNNSSRTVFHHLLYKLNFEGCELMMKYIGDNNPICKSGFTPLHTAALQGNFKIFKLLMDNIDEKSPTDCIGDTPLHTAVKHYSPISGHFKIIKMIIKNSDNKNPKNNKGHFFSNHSALTRRKNATFTYLF